jgi:catalase
MSDGTLVEAQQKIDGGPSVLYDAVVILASETGAEGLATDATTKDFISDAFAHCKFIGYAPTAEALLDAVGVEPDGGVVAVKSSADIGSFLKLCHGIRFWDREPNVNRT